ncbi:hypothetical protein [Synechocystis sp. PCC 7509]|nr:hypothetical protein [Synechocystis sp. PCC 7509]
MCLLTIQKYHQMLVASIPTKDDRVKVILGEIVTVRSPLIIRPQQI